MGSGTQTTGPPGCGISDLTEAQKKRTRPIDKRISPMSARGFALSGFARNPERPTAETRSLLDCQKLVDRPRLADDIPTNVDVRKSAAENDMCKKASLAQMALGNRPITGKEAMRYFNQGRFRQQVEFLRCQFLQDGELPFSNVLSEEVVAEALAAISTCWLDRIYSPLVELWVFLSQDLSADHSCRAAVARLIAHGISPGQCPCSGETGAYCQARKRLPEEFFSDVARRTGRVGSQR